MTPAVIAGEEPVDGVHEVIIAAGPGLDDRHPGGGVGNEDGQQTISLFCHKARHLWREVDYASVGNVERNLQGVQGS